jgi:hypothetical protein
MLHKTYQCYYWLSYLQLIFQGFMGLAIVNYGQRDCEIKLFFWSHHQYSTRHSTLHNNSGVSNIIIFCILNALCCRWWGPYMYVQLFKKHWHGILWKSHTYKCVHIILFCVIMTAFCMLSLLDTLILLTLLCVYFSSTL